MAPADKTVELGESSAGTARIVPEESSSPPGDWPDFAALREEMFGERVLLERT